jgi:hypothetical protein
MDGIISAYFDGVSLGTSVSHGLMTVVPIFAPLVSEEYEYLVLQDALDSGVLKITELSEIGSVPQLLAINKGKIGILIIGGEQLVGAKQDRVANTTILLALESKTVIPVSCTENGRWSYTSREFRSSDFVMSSDSRKKKMRSVSESLKHKSSYDSDQGEVWEDIASLNRKAGAQSSTGAMKDGFEAKKMDINDLIGAFPIQPHQRGILVLLNGIAAGFEMFSREDAFLKLYSKLLHSYVIDAVLLEPRQTNKSISTAAKTFFADIRNCNGDTYPAVGSGEEFRFNWIGIIGSGLVHENVPVYLAFYTLEESPRPHRGEGMTGFRNRRSHAMHRNVAG